MWILRYAIVAAGAFLAARSTDRHLQFLVARGPMAAIARLASGASFGLLLGLPWSADALGPVGAIILLPAALIYAWAHWVGPRYGSLGRRYRVLTSYQRLLQLSQRSDNEARRHAARRTLEALPSSSDPDYGRLAELMRVAWEQRFIARTMTDDALDAITTAMNEELVRVLHHQK